MTYSISSHDWEYRRLIKKIKKYQKEIDKALREDGPHSLSINNFRTIQINDLMIKMRQLIEQRLEQKQ